MILFYAHYILLLLFGVVLSFAFADVRFDKKNMAVTGTVFAVCGLMQLFIYAQQGENMVWKMYPIITHLPIILTLLLYYRKKTSTVFAAVSSAYLCCQLPKWLGIMMESLSGSNTAGIIVRIAVILVSGYFFVAFIARYISEIYNKETSSVLIFGSIPMIYYVFDYSMAIYTDFWLTNNKMATEFMPFFICIIYFLFCILYYREYERKADALRKEQITTLAAQQQQKEMEAIRQSEREIRILRHDMKHFLDTLAVHLEKNEVEASIKLVEGLTTMVQSTAIRRFCANEMVNYVLSSYSSKCDNLNISLEADIVLEDLETDEIMFCSVLSNALDNAVIAVKELPPERRRIMLMLKNSGGHLLLSVRNQYRDTPVMADGMPVSTKQGHGYGTQSIRYMTEKLGGNCQFSIKDQYFILRVII